MTSESQKAQEYFEANSGRIRDHLCKVKFVEDVQFFICPGQTAYLSVVLISSFESNNITDIIGDIEAAFLSFDVCDKCANTLDDMFELVAVQKLDGFRYKYLKLYWREGLASPSSEYGGD
ncbi:hypothetical protein F4814DRAFT_458322 [Daldinia grandis]|nr:hypothetical protein F4814DRAFT_458322 [Daldinia grandis]